MKPASTRQYSAYDTPETAAQAGAGLPGAALIMTLAGERPVAGLRPGDRIVTRDSGTAVLRALRGRHASGPMVHVRAGSLGHARPGRDTLLPAGQPVLVRDWRARALFGAPRALVPARRLVDGTFVTLRPNCDLTVCDLIFDTPHVLYVDGLELASCLSAPVTG